MAEVPAPAPGPEELVVDVAATALNRADLLQCLGMYPAPAGAPPDIPGLEYAGVVKQVGPRVRRFRPGDRVMGLVAGGAFAEQLTTHEREAVPIPAGLSFAEAAAIPEAFITAYDAMVLQGELRPAETVLIHAVASGVGTAALQLARAFRAHPLGTSRSPDKLERCRELGLEHGILVSGDVAKFAEEVRTRTGGRGAELVLELVGGDYLAESIEAAAPRGRVMLVGLLGGAHSELPLRTLLSRRVRIQGTVLRSRALEEKIGVAQSFEREVLPFFERNELRPVIDSVFPVGDLQKAFVRMASNQSLGKIVVTWK